MFGSKNPSNNFGSLSGSHDEPNTPHDDDEEEISSEESSEDEDNPNKKKKDPETEKKLRIDRAKQQRTLKITYMVFASTCIYAYLNLVPNPFNDGEGMLIRRI